MFYGLTRKKQAYELAKDVVIGIDGKYRPEAVLLLLETCQQETHLGSFRDPSPDGAGRGISQIDPIGFTDAVDRARAEELENIKQKFGIDLNQVEHDDLDFQPLTCLIVTRLKYKRIPAAIPNSVAGRADYWKEHYNSFAGKGTPEEYIHNAEEISHEILSSV